LAQAIVENGKVEQKGSVLQENRKSKTKQNPEHIEWKKDMIAIVIRYRGANEWMMHLNFAAIEAISSLDRFSCYQPHQM
jgi:hypothetical protein